MSEIMDSDEALAARICGIDLGDEPLQAWEGNVWGMIQQHLEVERSIAKKVLAHMVEVSEERDKLKALIATLIHHSAALAYHVIECMGECEQADRVLECVEELEGAI